MSDNFNPAFKKPMKKGAAPTGHEAFLKTLESAGAKVSLRLIADPEFVLVGTIKHSDKYTISLRVDDEDGTYQVYVIFKHAIEMFWTNPNDQKA